MRVLSTLLLYLSINFANCTRDYLQHPVKSCHIGDSIENECNKCLCTSKRVFECTSLSCDKNKTQNEIEFTKQLCVPNQLYVLNLITCICTKDGRWPHISCHGTFLSLPLSNVVKHRCQPDSYVPIDCNVCRCGPDGEINSDQCTRNSCEDKIKRRNNVGANNVYSNCEVKNWYSLASCQFCFCVNQNKLVCNTGNYYSKKLELGSYNLRICGKDLIREAIELIPENQKILRYGYFSSNSSTTEVQGEAITSKPTTITTIREEQNIAIEVNQENSEDEKVPDEQASSSKEYYTDTEEEPQSKSSQKPKSISSTTTVKTNIAESQGPSTKFSIQDGDEMLSESDEESDEDSNEIMSDPNQSTVTPAIKTTTDSEPRTIPEDTQIKDEANGDDSAESYQYIGNTLRINLPKVLNKVFKMALRKSMVTLTNKTKCTPGSSTVSDCNTCFCLKNGKLLCTDNKCSNKGE